MTFLTILKIKIRHQNHQNINQTQKMNRIILMGSPVQVLKIKDLKTKYLKKIKKVKDLEFNKIKTWKIKENAHLKQFQNLIKHANFYFLMIKSLVVVIFFAQ